MGNHEIHSTHECFGCAHMIPWNGDLFGGITIAHGNEVEATVSLTGKKDDQVVLAVQLKCPECGAVNQFKDVHHK